jgi:hypothetical protein
MIFFFVAGIGSTPTRWLVAYVGKTSSWQEENKGTTGEKDREV